MGGEPPMEYQQRQKHEQVNDNIRNQFSDSS